LGDEGSAKARELRRTRGRIALTSMMLKIFL
jgi:hypothetical protein